jgi:hypothetical protein
VRLAVDAALPHYQLTAELVKLKGEIVAEVEREVAALEPVAVEAASTVEETGEKDEATLVARVEALRSKKAADELAAELEVVLPPEAKTLVAKVEILLEKAKELDAKAAADAEAEDEDGAEETPAEGDGETETPAEGDGTETTPPGEEPAAT